MVSINIYSVQSTLLCPPMSNTGAHAHTGVREGYISISNRGMITEGRGVQPQLVYLSNVQRESPAFLQKKQKKHQLFLEIGLLLAKRVTAVAWKQTDRLRKAR